MSEIEYSSFDTRRRTQSNRWALMREFLCDWDLPHDGAESVPNDEITDAESRLGFALPQALKEWYQLPFNPFFLDCKLFWTHLTWPLDLKIWPENAANDGAIVFKTEYQCCCDWAFLVKEAHLTDPPVYIGVADDGVALQDWELQNATLSEFMLQLLMVRSVDFASRFHACKSSVDEGLWGTVERNFSDVGFPPWLEYGTDCRLLGGVDCLLLVRSSPPFVDEERALCLNARTAQARYEVRRVLGIEWDCESEARADDGEKDSISQKAWWRFW